MATFIGTPDQTIDLVRKGIEAELRSLLLARFNEARDEALKALNAEFHVLATAAAENVVDKLEAYNNHFDNRVQLLVNFNVPKGAEK
jgi:hypothetical protein